MPSPGGADRPMSRQELAELVNGYLFDATGSVHNLDANYVGKLERGDHRWPSALYRQAFRAVLKAATDADLGFYIPGRSGGSGGHQAERTPEAEVSPTSEGFPHDRPELHAEIVTLYPRRAMAPDRLWLDLLKSAYSEIALFANASLFLPEDNPESISLLRAKAQSGVRVRIMLGDPDSREVEVRTYEERIPIAGRVAMALAYYHPLATVPGVEFRQHRTTLYNSIFRFDDQMLVNQHAYGCYGYMAPLLHLRHLHDGGLFDTYVRSFERIWHDESYPYQSQQELPTGGRLAANTAQAEHGSDHQSGVAQVR
jgi:hypothetical protein